MILLKSTETHAEESLKGFQYSNDWTGTRLDLMDLSTAAQKDEWSMAKWPDPVLRRPASPVTCHYFSTNTLQAACHLLKQTARREGAVGLAAQQCGVDANIVFLDSLSSIQQRGGMVSSMTLINPRIVKRSPETSMQVWKEQCLVLPPSFTATLVRDAWVEVEYQTIQGNWKRKRFNGEAARCVQHEMDHDRGILITDHVSLDELENEVMRTIEIDGHKDRMALAYSRRTDDSGSDAKDSKSCE
jgi:peptide deformylase